jgi:hypothetical protein
MVVFSHKNPREWGWLMSNCLPEICYRENPKTPVDMHTRSDLAPPARVGIIFQRLDFSIDNFLTLIR